MNTKCIRWFEKLLNILKQIASLPQVPVTALGLMNKRCINCTLCRRYRRWVTRNIIPVAAQFIEPGTSVSPEKRDGLVRYLAKD